MALFDGSLDPALSVNFSEYDSPEVNRLIDRALAEPDRDRRAALWGQIDQRIMRDAPLVPLLWQKFSFQWSSRVRGWRYDPGTFRPDLTAVWLGTPRVPDRGDVPLSGGEFLDTVRVSGSDHAVMSSGLATSSGFVAWLVTRAMDRSER